MLNTLPQLGVFQQNRLNAVVLCVAAPKNGMNVHSRLLDRVLKGRNSWQRGLDYSRLLGREQEKMVMINAPTAPNAEYVDVLADSRLWKHFRPRADDIIIVTPPKSGTTWTQAIVALLLSGDPGFNASPSINSPWIDAAGDDIDEVFGQLEAQTQRRYIKTHTPLDGIPVWHELTYICVYRHPVDVYFSWRKHEMNMTFELDDLPIIEDPSEGFRDYLDSAYKGTAGARLPGLLNHYKCTLAEGNRPNVLRLHYADMTRDLAAEMARVADHLGVSHSPEVMASLVDAATFDNMKQNAARCAPAAGKGVWHRDDAFFDSASSNKWEGQLTEDDLTAYDAKISLALKTEERDWLEWGNARSGQV